MLSCLLLLLAPLFAASLDASIEHVATLRGHAMGVTALAFSPDGRALLSSGEAGDVIVWDLAAETIERRLEPPVTATQPATAGPRGTVHHHWVGWVGFSPDGQCAFAAGDAFVVWDLSTGDELRRFALAFDAAARTVECDNRFVLRRTSEHVEAGRTRVWSVSEGRVVLDLPVATVTLTPATAAHSLLATVRGASVTLTDPRGSGCGA